MLTVYCSVYNICKSKIHDNNSTAIGNGEIEVW